MTVALAAPHTAAVEAGRAAVEAGGNAIDAALAAAAVLTVVYPHQCSLGGDLVALVQRPGGDTTAIVSVGAAARRTDLARLEALGAMPRQGADAVTVPGVVAGWTAVAGQGAVLPLASALERAATLARDGFEVSAGLGRAIEVRRDGVLADPGLAAVFSADGTPLAAGDWLRQPALADTLDLLAADPTEMYTGRVAAALVSGLAGHGSALQLDDFADHAAEASPALERTIGSAQWWVAPPPTQGVVLLGILPTALDGDVDALLGITLDAFTARQNHLGDPRSGPIDVEALLNPGPESVPAPKGGRALGDTVAIVAADADGTVVSIIQSVFQLFGAGILDPETGIVLQNRGAAFSVDPRHPGRIAPGARPPHTLLPLIARTEGLSYGLGCQGGSAQPWILAQVAPDLLSPAVDPGEVLARHRWVVGVRDIGHETLTMLVEPGRPDAVASARARGVPVDERDGLLDEAGHVQVVRRFATPIGEQLDAASDARADGRAEVFPSPSKEPT